MTVHDSLRLGAAAVVSVALSACSIPTNGGAASATCSAAPVAAPTLFLVSPIVGSTVPSSTTRIYVGIQPNTYVPMSSSLTLSGADGTQVIGAALIADSSAPSPAATPGNAQPYALYESNVTGLESAQTYRVSLTVSTLANLDAPCGGATAAALGSFQTM